MIPRVFLLVLLARIAFGLDLQKIRPIHESVFWRQEHPALAKLIARSESLEKAVLGTGLVSSRITGGQFANTNQFPYQAALVISLPTEQSFCGGSLISNNFVLTAAHCLDTATMATVMLGAHNVSQSTESSRSTQLIMARNFLIHEGYNQTQYQNDIALLQLNIGVQENSFINVIALPRRAQADTTFAGYSCVVSGWGRFLDTTDQFSDALRYVNLNVLDNSGCTPFFGEAVTTMKVCTSGAGRVGPCGGDSGGPVVIEDGGVKTQIGLVSFSVGFGCQLGWPTVHTRTSKYLDWIAANSDVVIRA